MSPPKILITEDEMLTALDLQQRLCALGYEVPALVASGEEAIEQAALLKPDLVLMDIMLQGELDGIQAAQLIRARADIPVIYLTANSDSTTLERVKRTEAFGYLLKPFRARELQITIDMALKNHSLKRQLVQAHNLLEQRVQERTGELVAAVGELQTQVIERRRAEASASEWRQRYDLIVAASGQAVYDLDLVSGALIVSPGVEAVLGHPPEALNQNMDQWARFIHPDDRGPILDRFNKCRVIGSPFDVHYRFQHGDGHYLWIHDLGCFARDAKGDVVRMLGMMQDVTQRKLAEDKIREQAALLDKTHDAIMVRDLDNRVLYWNHGAERIYGWTSDEAVGKPIHELLLRGDLAHLPVAHDTALRTGEWSGEVHVYPKDGRQLTVQSRWTLLCDDAGKPRAFLTAHTDLTERKQLEAKFLRAQRLESIGALASGIAHDLNNVFTPIMMASQLLEGRVAPDSHEMLKLLQTSSRRGSDMVKQVLSFSRGNESEVGLVQLKHLIGEMERVARDTFPRHIQIRTALGQNLWPVKGDSTPLYQVLMNLCINARDAMPQGGVLTIEAQNREIDAPHASRHPGSNSGPYTVLSVSDTGTGISPENRQRIFEPFFTTKAVGEGTGLGLSTVMSIVKAHQGWVELESELGLGTRFHIFLPAVSTAQTMDDSEVSETPDGNGELLLVVDDETAIREMLKTTLEAHGYDVLAAAEGTEAMALYASNKGKIALVITDLVMPFMDGPATMRALRKMDPEVKLLAVTGMPGKGKIAQIASEQQVTILSKPYSIRSLLTAIRSVLNPES